MLKPQTEFSRLLLDCQSRGEAGSGASRRLFELVYEELRRIASAQLRNERPGHTLQPTALVHEAYLRLAGGPGNEEGPGVAWQNRAHFLGTAARAMRRVLVDHARRRGAAKRGGDAQRVTLHTEDLGAGEDALGVLELHEALSRFAALDERAARIVELRVFGGLSVRETAQLLEVSPRTVDGDWAVARMWLARELGAAPGA